MSDNELGLGGNLALLGVIGTGALLWNAFVTTPANKALSAAGTMELINRESVSAIHRTITLEEVQKAKIIELREGSGRYPSVSTCELVFEEGRAPTLFFKRASNTTCDGTRQAMHRTIAQAQNAFHGMPAEKPIVVK